MATKLALAAGACLMLFVLAEGVASLVLAWSVPDEAGMSERSHCTYDPLLGWVNVPNTRVEDLYGPGLDLNTNARGLRGTNAVEPKPAAGRFRVLCLGDSFTLGYGVDDSTSFPAWIERLNPLVEAPNMGQGGYGIDQCFLWYRRDAADLEAQVVLLSFIAPDFERMLSDRFQGQYPKPRLRVEDGALVLPTEALAEDWSRAPQGAGLIEELSLTRLFGRLQWVRGGPTPEDDAYQPLGEAVLSELKALVEERGGKLVLAHIPGRDRNQAYTDAVLTWLKPFAADQGIPLFDLADEFSYFLPGEAEALYLSDGHMNALGNRRLAELLIARLRGHFQIP